MQNPHQRDRPYTVSQEKLSHFVIVRIFVKY